MPKVQDHRIRVAASRREEMQNSLMFSALVLASEKSIHAIDVDDIMSLTKTLTAAGAKMKSETMPNQNIISSMLKVTHQVRRR